MRLLRILSFTALGLVHAPAVFAATATQQARQAAGHLESWVALAMILVAVLCAWLLGARAPKVRVIGILLASAACLSVAGWFLFHVLGTGFLEHPKPNQTPLDSAKPALLWLQSMVALGAGVALLVVAYRQSKSTRILTLPATNEKDRYGQVSRILHWSIAILFIALIPMGIFTSIIPEDTWYRQKYYIAHKTIGVVLLALIVLRLVWNRVSKPPELDASLGSGERRLAHGAHIILYGLMLGLPLTGFIMTTFHGYPTFFFAWDLPPLWGSSEPGTIVWGFLHKYLLPYLLYVVLGLHIVGTLKHQLFDKRSLPFRRMAS